MRLAQAAAEAAGAARRPQASLSVELTDQRFTENGLVPPPLAGTIRWNNSAQIGGWARLDAGARLDTRWGANAVTWRAGLDNLADRRAWRESPYQFGHAYLFPLAPRTLRLSVQADL